jgi:heterodisulfide reductase subunit B
MKYAYFPGCSLHSTAKEYNESTEAVCRELGVELQEIPDWSCCGATSAHNLDHELSIALPARNLGLAEKMGLDVVAPCASCFNRLKLAEHTLRTDPVMSEKINSKLNLPYGGGVSVKPLVDALWKDVGVESIAGAVKKPLADLKVACYYGCLMVRHPEVTKFDDPEDPQSLDDIVKALGAEPVTWYYKTECCGGSFSLTRTDIAVKMTHDVIDMAIAAGADCIVTACPLCQANLDMRQADANKAYGKSFNIPVFYFTELMAAAFGLPYGQYLAGHMIDGRLLLANRPEKQQEESCEGG